MRHVLDSLLGILQGSPLTKAESVPFLLQLMAWRKLRGDGRVPILLSLAEAAKHEDPEVAVNEQLALLRKAEVLGPDGEAFQASSNVAVRLSRPILERLLREVEQIDFSELGAQDIIGFLSEMDDLGRSSVFAAVPTDLAAFMCRVLGARPDDTVYVPFDSSFNLALQAGLGGREVYAEYRNGGLAGLTALLNILLGTRILVSSSDPVMDPGWVVEGRLRQFDAALSCPPLGARYRNEVVVDRYKRFPEQTFYGEVLQLRHIQAQTRGRAVVAAPNSLLLRAAAGERDFKADLVGRHQVSAVIALRGGTLGASQAAVSLLVLDYDRPAERILMVNAGVDHFTEPGKTRGSVKLRNVDELLAIIENRTEGAYSRLVGREECETTDYNLLPERYVASRDGLLGDARTVSLGDIAELIRPQFLKMDEGDEPGDTYPEVAAQDLGEDDYVCRPAKRLTVSRKMLPKAAQQVLQPLDILVLSKGWSVGKVALVPGDLAETWLANQSFLIVRLKRNLDIPDPVVLMRYLASPTGQALLASRAGGSTIPMLQTKELRNLPVIVPDPEKQAEVKETDRSIVQLYQQVRKLRAAAAALQQHHWPLEP